MTGSVVLVDTSAWIEFFNRPATAHHSVIADLLDRDRVAITGVIAAELLRGCRSDAETSDLEDALQGVLRIDVTFRDWLAIGRDLAALRRRGSTASLTDASVAHVARTAGLRLYTLDRDFRKYWPEIPLFDPSP